MEDANALLTELSSLLDTQDSLSGVRTATTTVDESFKQPPPLQQQPQQQHHQKQYTDSGINTQVFSEAQKTSSPSSLFPSVELFGSISSISAIFYHRKDDLLLHQHQQASATTSTIIPVLALTLAQPTCSFNTVNTPSFQLTLLDLSISTSSLHGGIQTDHVIPQLHSYDITVLSCAKGETNEMSGLLPTFIKFSLTMPQPGNMVIDAVVEKSVFLKCNYSLLSNLSVFKKALSSTQQSHNSNQNEKATVGNEEESNVTQPSLNALRLSAVNLRTNQWNASFSMSTPSGKENTALTMQYYSLDVKSTLSYCKKTHTISSCHLKTSIDGLNVGTSSNGRRNVFLRPANVTVEIKSILGFHTRSAVKKA